MTNGEKIKEIFPNIDSRLDAKTGIMIVKWADNTTKFFKTSWWNAEYKEPTTKNDLGVDAVSRQAVIDVIMANCIWENEYNLTSSRIKKAVENLPSVTPQEPFINKPCVSSEVCEHDKQKALDKIQAEITALQNRCYALTKGVMCGFCNYECQYKAENNS